MKPSRHSKRASAHWAVLTLMTAASLSAQAATDFGQDGFAFSASDLTNFRYRLVDLDPNDGITPSITFYSSLGDFGSSDQYAIAAGISKRAEHESIGEINTYPSLVSAAHEGGNNVPSSQWFTASPALQATSLDGAAVASLDTRGLAAASRLVSADIATYQQPRPAGWTGLNLEGSTWFLDAHGYGGHGPGTTDTGLSTVYEQVLDPVTGEVVGHLSKGVDWASPQYLQNQPRFILTGNTAVVFEFDMSAVASIDLTKLDNHDPLTTFGSANSGVFLQLLRDVPKDGLTHWDSMQEAEAALDLQLVGVGASVERKFYSDLQTLQKLDQSSQSFSLNFVNDGAQDLTGHIRASVYSGASASGLPAVVPEPATFALMGLGLVGIGLAARRRQPPAQA